MSDDQHQSLNEYHSDVVTPRGTLPNTAPPVPHNQAHNQATMPREYTVCSAYGVSFCVEYSQPVAIPDPPRARNIPGWYLRASTRGPSGLL